MSTVLYFNSSSATLTMTIWDDEETACISDLESTEKRKGHGTAVMRSATRFADDSNLTLTLQVESSNCENGLSDTQLISFYEKFGFVVKDEDTTPFMMREPQ
jgi:hypothetical protein